MVAKVCYALKSRRNFAGKTSRPQTDVAEIKKTGSADC